MTFCHRHKYDQTIRPVNIEVAIIADKLSLLLFKYRQCYRRYLWKEVSIRYRRHFFWLEISIKTIDTLRRVAALHVRCAAGEHGHRQIDRYSYLYSAYNTGNGLHVLTGAPTACITDAIVFHPGGYYTCSPAVLWTALAAVS